jgi:hypothetical protein
MHSLLTTISTSSCPVFAALLRRWGTGNYILTVIGLLSAVIAIWWLHRQWERQSGQRASHNPRKLFAVLCAAHKLDRNQQRLLLQLAANYHLPQPATIFLRPDLFDPTHLPPQSAPVLAQIQTLRQQLFGAQLAAAQSTPSSQTRA